MTIFITSQIDESLSFLGTDQLNRCILMESRVATIFNFEHFYHSEHSDEPRQSLGNLPLNDMGLRNNSESHTKYVRPYKNDLDVDGRFQKSSLRTLRFHLPLSIYTKAFFDM